MSKCLAEMRRSAKFIMESIWSGRLGVSTDGGASAREALTREFILVNAHAVLNQRTAIHSWRVTLHTSGQMPNEPEFVWYGATRRGNCASRSRSASGSYLVRLRRTWDTAE